MASSDDNDDAPSAKRQRSTVSPTLFLTWNCNSLTARCKKNQHDLYRLAADSPHVIFLQEVMCRAASETNHGVPCPQDAAIVEPLFQSGGPFQDYEAFWSLAADKKYAGTCTLFHKKRLGVNKGMAAFTTHSAIDLILSKCGLSRSDVDIPTTKKQAASYSVGSTQQQQHHQEHGRFQFFSLGDIDIINTYVPNHGNKPESFQRRKDWDGEMLEFLTRRQVVMKQAGCNSSRQLVWGGDLKVARDYRDGSHRQEMDGNIEEWWTDESKSLHRPGLPNREACHIGHACFTPAERTGFDTLLKEGHLVDVWRELHPDGSTTSPLSTWARPDYTWRGSAGRYADKGMRIDYFITGNVPLHDIEECEILGYGKREGLFCGSDHCAVKLVLRK